jgi:alkylated DNA repair dioxygenase AlkB
MCCGCPVRSAGALAIEPPERIALPDAELWWWPQLLPPSRASELFDRLRAGLPWQQRTLRMFGRAIPEPRLVSWHGDPEAHYRYSGRTHVPQPWTAELTELRETVEAANGHAVDSVLANLYRDGNDHMGWHADDEPELGSEPVIASVSLGAARQFQFRPRPRGPIALRLDLPPGSMLVMAGATQRHYHHRIPRTSQRVGPRINLTFRRVAATR